MDRIFYEKVNIKKIFSIFNHIDDVNSQIKNRKILDGTFDEDSWNKSLLPTERLKRYIGNYTNDIPIRYRRPYKDQDRIYPLFYGLGGLPKDIRNYIADEKYVDCDIVACHHTLLQQRCKQLNIPTPCLDYYLNNREKVLASTGLQRGYMKNHMSAILNGEKKNRITNNRFLTQYYDEIDGLLSISQSVLFPNIRVINKKPHGHMGTGLRTIEYELLCVLAELRNIKSKHNVLCHDGIMVYDKKLTPSKLKNIEDKLEEKTGYRIKLALKPMKSVLDIPENEGVYRLYDYDERIEKKVRRDYMLRCMINETYILTHKYSNIDCCRGVIYGVIHMEHFIMKCRNCKKIIERKKFRTLTPQEKRQIIRDSYIKNQTTTCIMGSIPITTKYVSDSMKDVNLRGCVCIKTPTGTGKTTWAKLVLKQYKRILFLSFRRSFADFISGEFNCVNYQDVKSAEWGKQDRIVVSVESLHKLKDLSYDCIVLDEFDSIMSQLAQANTHGGKLSFNQEKYIDLLTNTPHILVMDANLSQMDIDFLKIYRNDITIYEYTLNDPTRKAVIVDSMDNMIGLMNEYRSRGEKFVVAHCTGREEAQIIGERNHCVISSHTSKTDIRDIMKNINNYDEVIYTPTLYAGVSITNHPFKSVFCFVDAKIVSSSGVIQMLNRFRDINKIYLFVKNFYYKYTGIHNKYELEKIICEDLNECRLVQGIHSSMIDQKLKLITGKTKELLLHNGMKTINDRERYEELLYIKLRENNWNIVFNSNDAEDKLDTEQKISLRLRRCHDILSCEDYEGDRLKRLEEAEELEDPIERDTLLKYRIAQFYRVRRSELTEEMVYNFITGSNKRRIQQYRKMIVRFTENEMIDIELNDIGRSINFKHWPLISEFIGDDIFKSIHKDINRERVLNMLNEPNIDVSRNWKKFVRINKWIDTWCDWRNGNYELNMDHTIEVNDDDMKLFGWKTLNWQNISKAIVDYTPFRVERYGDNKSKRRLKVNCRLNEEKRNAEIRLIKMAFINSYDINNYLVQNLLKMV